MFVENWIPGSARPVYKKEIVKRTKENQVKRLDPKLIRCCADMRNRKIMQRKHRVEPKK
jgi:hypothetical protein